MSLPSAGRCVEPLGAAVSNVALLHPGYLNLLRDGSTLTQLLQARHPDVTFSHVPLDTNAANVSARAAVRDDVAVATALRDADAIFCQDLPDDVLKLAPRLRWVQTLNSGVERLPLAALRERGVQVSNAAGCAAPEIAEFVMARILEHYKRLPELATRNHDHTWTQVFGRPLAGATIGLLGFGPINQRVARLATVFDMFVVVCRRSSSSSADHVQKTYPLAELGSMLSACDVLVSALPDNQDTRGILGARSIAAMKPGCMVVNVGRGSAIDESSLVSALRSGQVGAAALDVFAVEPLATDHLLWDHAKVSAHCASVPVANIERVADLFSENLRRHRDGVDLLNGVRD